jgi:hypothetical protein
MEARRIAVNVATLPTLLVKTRKVGAIGQS